MAKTITERTLVIAHRGAPWALCGVPGAVAPENTMPAFELAAAQKADGIETDVHFSKDGKVMIIHDAKLDRTTNGQGLVTDYTYDELQVFDAGIKCSKDYKGTRIPTIDELFKLCYDNSMVLNIEIKSADPAMPAAIDELAAKYKMKELTIYSSFDHAQLERMLKVNPDAFVAPLYGFNMVKPWDYTKNMGAKAVHPRDNQLDLYPEYVEKCHELGIRVHPWTVDDPEQAKKLAAMGCDAVITNRPSLIMEALGIKK